MNFLLFKKLIHVFVAFVYAFVYVGSFPQLKWEVSLKNDILPELNLKHLSGDIISRFFGLRLFQE